MFVVLLLLSQCSAERQIPNAASLSPSEAAQLFETDKVTLHDYHSLYSLIFSDLSRRLYSVNLFEIGFGCGMKYGGGKSEPYWRSLGAQNIDYGDIKLCGTHPTLRYFDQGKNDSYAKMSFYDIIVDDGSHRRIHQLNSLYHAWPRVSAGGWLVIEDLFYNDVSVIPELKEIAHCLAVHDPRALVNPIALEKKLKCLESPLAFLYVQSAFALVGHSILAIKKKEVNS